MKTLKEIVFLFLVIVSIQSDGQPIKIVLEQVYELSLNSNQSLTYEIIVPDNWVSTQNLYITGYSPINDPYQQPILFIKSDTFSQTCQDSSNNLDEVCLIPSQQLSVGKKITVDARCRINCKAKLVAYLSEVVQLDLNEQVYIETQSSPIQKNFRIFVPTNAEFSEIFLFLRLTNLQNFRHGTEMYLNINSNNSFPSRQKHTNVSLKNWGFDKALILKRGVDVMPGDFINLVLIIPAQTALLFESRNILNNTRQLQLNQMLFDYLDESTTKRLYNIDLTSLDQQSLAVPIIVEFKQFSGNPNIEVSLSPEFKKEDLLKNANSSWVRFYVYPEMMKSPQFTKIIYIRVSSQWGATFLLYSKLRRDNYNSVFEGVTQFVNIEASSLGVLIHRHNEIFQSLNESKSLEFKVENEGEVEADVRIFQCLQENTFKCEINKDSDLNQLPTQYRQIQIIDVRQIIKLKYSASDCLKSKNEQGNDMLYVCTTMIVLIPKEKSSGQYAVTLQPQQNIETLAEGQTRFQSVDRQRYRYFYFYLSGDAMAVTQLFIYLHLIDGNVLLLASPDVGTPSLNDTNNMAVKTGTSQVTFTNPKTGVYYISVYGLQNSDFMISVIVRRLQTNSFNFLAPNPTDRFSQNVKLTDIQLRDGLAQIFTLDKGYIEMKFKFRVTGNGNVTLLITEYVGKVQTFYTRDSTHKRQQCGGNMCEFVGSRGQTFFVEVSGDRNTIRKFAIVFKQINECYKYSTGSPFFIYLEKDDSECQQFAVNTGYPIEISNSLTSLQILDKVVEIFVEFQSNQTFVMSQSSHIFSQEELSKYCKQKSECKMKVKSRSFSESVSFHSIVQRIDGVITLYDGVKQSVDHTITAEGKLFRYPILSEDSIDVFLATETYSQYTILAQIVDQTQNSQIQNYPQRNENKSFTNGFWGISSSEDSPTLTILHINKKKIQKFISDKKMKYPWLLIRVLGDDQAGQRVVYTLQITQNERSLKQGEQHVGYVQTNQIVTYQIYPSMKSLLSIKTMERNKCFKLLDEKKKLMENDVIIQGIKVAPITFYVQSLTNQNCMYQVSLQNYQSSVVAVTQGFPTGVVLEYKQLTYLLYYHNRNTSFKIYEFIQVGASQLYISPLSNFNIEDGLNQILGDVALDEFKYKSNYINNIEVEATYNSSSYCFSCYYLIAIRGTPSVKEDIVVVPTGVQGIPVIVKQHSIIDSTLDPGQNETFIYYSSYSSNFNLSIDVVYGRIIVTVKSFKQGSQGKIEKIQGVQRNTIVLPIEQNAVPPLNLDVPTPTNAIDERIKYKIEVKGVRKAAYHLQIITYSKAFRIYQGIASRITIPAMGQIKLEFESILDRNDITLNIETNLFFLNRLSANVYFYKSGYTQANKDLIDFKTDTIGKVLTLTIPSMRGHYIVQISNPLNSEYNMIALMPRPGLTQLRELHSVASDRQSIYQMYIEEDSYGIIEVFVCIGDIRVRGSAQIQQLLGGRPHPNQIQLVHENFGGHYVITTPPNVTGQYFIRLQNKQFSAHMNEQVEGISYMISYRMNKINQINPYYLLDAPDFHIGIRRADDRENISLYAKNVKPINSSIKVKSILYIFAVGSSPEDIKQLLFCRSSKNEKHFIYTTMVTGDQKVTQFNISKLQILKRTTSKTHLYFGGTGIAMVEENGQISDSIIFIYDPSFLGQLKTELAITTFGFFQIMVLISAAVGGSVVIYSLVVHLFKLRLGYFQSNQLVQQQSIQNKVEAKDGQFEISKMKQQKQKEDRSEQELK